MRVDANKIAEQTKDAYSFSRYGQKSWAASCRMLLRRGYNAKQIEAIMRSKWTRRAGDTSKDLERFLDDPRNQCTLEHVNGLIAGTF